MKTIKVFEYKSGEPIGRGEMSDERFAQYEAILERNPSGAVKLSDWLDEEGRANVIAQDDTTVWFELVQRKDSEQ